MNKHLSFLANQLFQQAALRWLPPEAADRWPTAEDHKSELGLLLPDHRRSVNTNRYSLAR